MHVRADISFLFIKLEFIFEIYVLIKYFVFYNLDGTIRCGGGVRKWNR